MSTVLTEPDQLRHRVAWALSQIVVAGNNDMFVFDVELWATFYDIFVHNAFKSYLDIMREVSISPVMGRYVFVWFLSLATGFT